MFFVIAFGNAILLLASFSFYQHNQLIQLWDRIKKYIIKIKQQIFNSSWSPKININPKNKARFPFKNIHIKNMIGWTLIMDFSRYCEWLADKASDKNKIKSR
jgi:hypothetical protein